jgi:hypothetical protein
MSQIIDNERQRFIPINLSEIIADLLATNELEAEQAQYFKSFCQVFTALYHYKFKLQLDKIKHTYQVFNPDTDLLTQRKYSTEQQQQLRQELIAYTQDLLNHANYEQLTIDKINEALTKASPYGLNVQVNLDDYANLLLYYRGAATKIQYQQVWYKFFLPKQRVEIPIYKRLFMMVTFKTRVQRLRELMQTNKKLSEKQAIRLLRRSYSRDLELEQVERYIFVKLFKNVAQHDLEMLFPNRKIKFKLLDKIKIAITGGGGMAAGGFGLINKIGLIATNPMGFLLAMAGFMAVLIRQITNVMHHQTKYMMLLSQNLYFHNLSNNYSVFSYLNNAAEEEECKEAILAYYFLVTQPDKLWTQAGLDEAIEHYLQQQYGVDVDFEVDDGLHKLAAEQLLSVENGILKVLDLKTACQCLDKQWDDFFSF